MHPLLDRRDLTAQRTAPPPAPPALDASPMIAQLERVYRELCTLLRQDQANVVQLCVTDGEVAESEMANFPVPGARRLIVRRPGSGGSYPLVAATPLAVLQPNDNRLGGQLVNVGANAVTLFLARDLLSPGTATPLPVGAPQIVLNGGGGAWDLRLSNLLWCGGVIAVAAAGGSTLSVAEV